jgi:hypothetical protein
MMDNTKKNYVYALKDGLYICGFNGGGFFRLCSDKEMAHRYVDNDGTRAFAAKMGCELMPTRGA